MFRELVIGDVLVAPIVTYAVAALIIVLALRPLLFLVRFSRFVSNPALAELSLYVAVFALLIQFA